jgi:hypothetical protein
VSFLEVFTQWIQAGYHAPSFRLLIGAPASYRSHLDESTAPTIFIQRVIPAGLVEPSPIQGHLRRIPCIEISEHEKRGEVHMKPLLLTFTLLLAAATFAQQAQPPGYPSSSQQTMPQGQMPPDQRVPPDQTPQGDEPMAPGSQAAVVDGQDHVIGIVSQADLALKGKPERVSKIVAEISKPTRPSAAA